MMNAGIHVKMALKSLEAAIFEAAEEMDEEDSGLELITTHLQALEDLIDYVLTKEE